MLSLEKQPSFLDRVALSAEKWWPKVSSVIYDEPTSLKLSVSSLRHTIQNPAQPEELMWLETKRTAHSAQAGQKNSAGTNSALSHPEVWTFLCMSCSCTAGEVGRKSRERGTWSHKLHNQRQFGVPKAAEFKSTTTVGIGKSSWKTHKEIRQGRGKPSKGRKLSCCRGKGSTQHHGICLPTALHLWGCAHLGRLLSCSPFLIIL